MIFISRRIRRQIIITGGLAIAMLGVLAWAPASQADTRVVGPDGNLWVLDVPGSVTRIDAGGTSTSFPIPPGKIPEALSSGPGQNLTAVLRPSDDPTSAPSIQRIDLNGVFDWSSTGLGTVMALKPFGDRGLSIGPDGSAWVSQGWSPCVSNSAGNLMKVSPQGTLKLLPSPILDDRDFATYVSGPIVVDGAGRAWVDTYGPDEENCVEGSRQWSATLHNKYVDANGEVRRSRCSNDDPTVVVATDGAAWCYGSDKVFRLAVDGGVREYDYPEGWADPDFMRAGPRGSIWFAGLTETNGGSYVPPRTVASISPAGELRTYPTLEDTLVEETLGYGPVPYEAFYDFYFTRDDRIWLLKRRTTSTGPLESMIDIPAGESQGQLPNRPSQFPAPRPVDEPDPPPKPDPPDPGPLRVEFRGLAKINGKKLRRSRTIRAWMLVSETANVTVRATIGNRKARRLGLRSKSSRKKSRMVLASDSGFYTFGNTQRLKLRKRHVRKLTFRKSRSRKSTKVVLRLDAVATAGAKTARASRRFIIK